MIAAVILGGILAGYVVGQYIFNRWLKKQHDDIDLF